MIQSNHAQFSSNFEEKEVNLNGLLNLSARQEKNLYLKRNQFLTKIHLTDEKTCITFSGLIFSL